MRGSWSYVRSLVTPFLAGTALVLLLLMLVRFGDRLRQRSVVNGIAPTGIGAGVAGTGMHELMPNDKVTLYGGTAVEDNTPRSTTADTQLVFHSPGATSVEPNIQTPGVTQETRSRPPAPGNSTKVPVERQPPHRLLSIELVIAPYLHHNTSDTTRLLERHNEYKTALQRNLNHNLVSHVHLLTSNPEESRSVFHDMANEQKLIVAEVKTTDQMRVLFDYISENLVGKDVLFTNADIYLGGGFDRVDPLIMAQHKIFYSLTRRSAPQDKCKSGRPLVDFCLEQKYIASHDTFLFHLNKPLPEEVLKELEFPFPSHGMENFLMWLFKEQLNYCLLNPCSVLETFHLHCSQVREAPGIQRGWVQSNGRIRSSPPTIKLVCT